NFQMDVDHRMFARFKGKAVALETLESGRFRRDLIGPGRKEWDCIFAGIIGYGLRFRPGGKFFSDDPNVWHQGSLGIAHRAADGRSELLPECRQGEASQGREKEFSPH